MIFEISDWYGRFGNNFISLVRSILSAKKYNAKLIIPKHKIFETYNIDFSNISSDNSKLFKHNFFEDNEYIVKISNEELIECINEYILKMIPKNLYNEFPDDILVIHIRSGDIFINDYFNDNKIQPPFSYYDKLITELNYRKYLIVSETWHNPVIKMLKDKYNDKIIINDIGNTIYNINDSFKIDLSILLSAKNIVLTPTTLSTAVLLLSEKKNVYFFNTKNKYDISDNIFYPTDKILWYKHNTTIHYYNDISYFEGINNSDDMIDKILNYKL
jgi:hypothetical protein